MVKRAAILLTGVSMCVGVFLAAPADAQYVDALQCNCDSAFGEDGDPLTALGDGFAPGSTVTLTLVDADTEEVVRTLGTVTADANGEISVTLDVPDDIPEGLYILTATGTASDALGGGVRTLQCPCGTEVLGEVVERRVAFTGSNSGTMATIGLGIIGVGALTLFVAKRRERDSVDAGV